jgi:DNA gyrase/topoisomerase IV subunit B
MGEIRCEGTAAPTLAFSDAQFQSICAELRERGHPRFTALRYRGLGSLDRDALEAHCMVPATRNLRWLTSADALAAMDVFGSLRALPPQRTLL